MKGERLEDCDGIRWILSGQEASPKNSNSKDTSNPEPKAMLLEFPDLTSYLAYLDSVPSRGWDKNWKTEPGDPNWCPYDFSETMGHARRGWDEGVLRVKNALSKLPPSFLQGKAQQKLDVAGGYPDVPKAAMSEVFSMVDIGEDIKNKHPTISLLINGGINGSFKSSNIVNFGAAICAAIDWIESIGIQVEVYYTDLSSGGKTTGREYQHWYFGPLIKIKGANQMLDITKLAFVTGHPGMLRRFFAVALTSQDTLSFFGGGLGCACTIQERHIGQSILNLMSAPKQTVFLEANDVECSTIEAGLSVVQKQINEQLGLNVDLTSEFGK